MEKVELENRTKALSPWFHYIEFPYGLVSRPLTGGKQADALNALITYCGGTVTKSVLRCADGRRILLQIKKHA